jgi:filamentous hemagglutinin family protein
MRTLRATERTTELQARRHHHIDIHRSTRRRPLSRLLPFVVALWAYGTPSSGAYAAGTLPSGGHFTAGAGSITGSDSSLTINQSSNRGVIEWSSFSIGSTNRVAFNNGNGATLNRVTGGNLSTILGALTATGSLYLINPQGVVIGSSGAVTTGGRFLASTLDTCDCDFLAGRPLTFTGNSTASVVVLGSIGSTGGDILLIAPNSVVNQGVINAPQGTVEMAAGRTVLLQDSLSSKQLFVQTGSAGTVDNEGPISAAQVNLQAADGNIYALAGRHTTIRATGTAYRDGHVWLVADTGHVAQLGAVIASNADGSGGVVDASAKTISLGDSAGDRPKVEAAQWNLSAPVFTVGPITADAFQRSLNAGTSITLQTTGAQGASGDLNVISGVRWQGPASLTLAAYRNLTLQANATTANSGNGNLILRADATGIDNGGSVTNRSTLDWSHSTGIVSALYDFNGRYSPGTILTNQAWTAAPFSGLLTQSTVYQLINSAADFGAADQNSLGVYALGRDVTLPSGGGFGELGGQFDGMGHTVTMTSNLVGVILQGGVVRNVGIVGEGGSNSARGTAGILAFANHGTVVNSHSSGIISGAGTGDWLGGLIGFNDGAVERSWSNAQVSGQGGFLGGLVAFNDGTISQSYATGRVSSAANAVAGGLVGMDFGLVSQSYATGAVSSGLGGAAGGLLGNNSSSNGGIHESFATGPVHGAVSADPCQSTLVGGIAALNPANSIASDVFWNKDSTGQAQGTGAGQPPVPSVNGLTSEQMTQTASFPTYDFSATGVWAMPPGSTHPVLRWQDLPATVNHAM